METGGYAGLFLIALIGNATIFLPLPAALPVFVLGGVLNPFLVALVASVGAALGEGAGYILGFGAEKFLSKKNFSLLEKGKKWFQKGRGGLFIFILAATPLPDDIAGIAAGLFKYNVFKFLLFAFLGKLVMNTVLAFGGYYGIHWVQRVITFPILW